MSIFRMRLTFFFVGLLFLLSMTALLAAKGPKMDPQELVALHLKSIGSPEALSAIKTMVNEGKGTVRIVGGSAGMLEGPAYLLSDGPKSRFFLNLGQVSYPAEQYFYDGQVFDAGFLTPNNRSRLGVFLYSYDGIVKQGLFGGALTTGWLLLAPEKHDVKLQYNGIKKVEGKELLELKCTMKKKENDLSILFYFEPETYRHVRTIYVVSTAEGMSSGQKATTQGMTPGGSSRTELEERFGDFRVVNGLTLPANWRIKLTIDNAAVTSTMEWNLQFEKTMFNQVLNPSVFALK